MQSKLKVLFIAYYFPPVDGGGIPGAMRILKFLKYLQAEGHVLTQKKTAVRLPDNSIETNLPAERIVRAGTYDPLLLLLKFQFRLKKFFRGLSKAKRETSEARSHAVFSGNSVPVQTSLAGRFKDFFYHLNYFPDQASAWIIPAVLAGRRQISSQKIDVIFATGSPWSSLVVGYLLSKFCRKPLVVDFRDPWINNPFHHTKGPMLDRWAEKLERRIIKHASLVSLNTEPLRDEFVGRYPELNQQKFVVLPNGFDEDENNFATYVPEHASDELVIRHTGFLYGPRDPSVLLAAIRIVNQKAAEEGISKRWVFEQIGAISLNYDVAAAYEDMITDGSLKLLPQVSYDECQKLLKSADLLLNIQPGTKTQVPSKIYDYLSVGRPILNITPEDGALGRMVEKFKLGTSINLNDTDRLQAYLFDRILNTKWRTEEFYPDKNVLSIKFVTQRIDELLNAIRKSDL